MNEAFQQVIDRDVKIQDELKTQLTSKQISPDAYLVRAEEHSRTVRLKLNEVLAPTILQ